MRRPGPSRGCAPSQPLRGWTVLHLSLAIIEERRGALPPSQSRGKGASAAVLPMLAMLNQDKPRKRGRFAFVLVCAWLRVGPRGPLDSSPPLSPRGKP